MTRSEHDPRGDSAGADGDLPPGTAVGDYRIERLLGRGGMGAVYLARQPEIEARVAIKVLAAELSRDPRLVRRFVDEARAVNRIRHPNIIDIFAFGRLPPPDAREYFVMEYLEGETLAARLERGPLPPSEARRLLLQICEALQAAHAEKIIHRDLKPENLWIAMPRHGQPYAKVLDFGIAKLLESADPPAATETGVAMGTAHYMSPEQCRGEGIDARTDIYAMGVLLYLMWSGRLPFEAPTFLGVVTQQITAVPEPPSAHRPIAPRLERLIMSCLEKDPAGRPPSARALGEELDAALGEALPGETLPPERAAVVPAAAREAGAGAAAVASSEAMGTTERGARRGRNRFAIAAAVTIAAAAGAGVLLAVRPRRVEAPVALAPVAPPSAPVAPPPPAPIVETPAAHAREPRPRPAPRDRAKPAAAPAAARPASPLEERGFLKENPFR